MEGIVKQASDSRYWDLWNRQKLSSEHEMKRRHILQMSQVTYQLFYTRHIRLPLEFSIKFCIFLPVPGFDQSIN